MAGITPCMEFPSGYCFQCSGFVSKCFPSVCIFLFKEDSSLISIHNCFDVMKTYCQFSTGSPSPVYLVDFPLAQYGIKLECFPMQSSSLLWVNGKLIKNHSECWLQTLLWHLTVLSVHLSHLMSLRVFN